MVCDICKNPCATGRKLARDHCHKTGKQRGRLCFACNVGLGKFKDDPALLELAAKYVREGGWRNAKGKKNSEKRPAGQFKPTKVSKRATGSILPYKKGSWVIRWYAGTVNGKRWSPSEIVKGSLERADEVLQERLRALNRTKKALAQ